MTLPYLKKLHEEINETISLAVRDGDEVLYIERIFTSHLIPYNIRPGLKRPLYPNSMGKAILAFLSNGEREEILNRLAFNKNTSKVTIDKKRIESELNKIKKIEYTVSRNKYGSGIIAIAVPIFNREGVAFAGMNISIPANHCSNDKIFNNYLKLLIETGKFVSMDLGYLANVSE